MTVTDQPSTVPAKGAAHGTPLILQAYRLASVILAPAIPPLLDRRQRRGKEHPTRLAERQGKASITRPSGPVIWCHAASVGESLSVLPLIDRLVARDPALTVLVTTGTVTSARLLADRLPDRACHQFAPVDRPDWVERFFDHWRPDAALWVESEFWPNLLTSLRRRRIPAALINARLSERSFRRWHLARSTIAHLLASFDVILAQTLDEAERLTRLGAQGARATGNLKYAGPPLPADPEAEAVLRGAIGTRPVWLLASSHPGEEAVAADIHARLRERHPDLLTVVAPRHPDRGTGIAADLAGRGLSLSRRSEGRLPNPGDDIYLADTLGDLGILYRVVPVTLIGGSMAGHGGHNPIEPARLGSAIVHGPHMHNFAAIAGDLDRRQAAIALADARPATAAEALGRLIADPAERTRLAEAAAAMTAEKAGILDAVLDRLAPLFDRAGLAALTTPRDGAVDADAASLLVPPPGPGRLGA